MTATTPYFAEILKRGWTHLLWRGLFAIVFGVFTLMRPGISLTALVTVFGFYAFIDGAVACWLAFKAHGVGASWGMGLLAGILGIGIGIAAFAMPGTVALSLLLVIAVWAIIRGVAEIITAIRLRKDIDGEWLLILAGVASVVFGVLLIARPGAGILTLLWLIGGYAIFFGILLVLLAFKVRSFGEQVKAA
jgi:uncharacterized membrane protein HdeD (DUF308 family)